VRFSFALTADDCRKIVMATTRCILGGAVHAVSMRYGTASQIFTWIIVMPS